MKVLLINGSPKKNGCTYTALVEVSAELVKQGIETEIFYIGNEPVRGCTGCGYCARTGTHQCVFTNDTVNEAILKVKDCDGFIFGTPVHYAAASGGITSFLDRMFYAASSLFALKPGAAVASCRRGGASATLDQINKYFTIANMPVVSSQYWNMVHGNTPDEVKQDLEGMQTMRVLGRNMAWLLKSIEAGKKAGVKLPEKEDRIMTNFVR